MRRRGRGSRRGPMRGTGQCCDTEAGFVGKAYIVDMRERKRG